MGVKISVEQLAKDAILPCILHWNQHHFVVLYKVSRHRKGGHRFHIADPASQKAVFREEELERCWLAKKENGEDGLPIPPYKVYNIGNNSPENLLDFVQILQEELISAGVLPADYDFEAHKELVPMQPGDVPITYADTTPLEKEFGFKPNTPLREGLRKFAEWYKEFYL